MIALALFALYLALGVFLVHCQLPGKPLAIRLWLGLSLGFFLNMWLPALAAFLLPFGVLSQALAFALLLGLCLLAYILRIQEGIASVKPWQKQDSWALGLTALPFTLLGLYLLYTHILLPVDGALYTGQATYGDLPLHLSLITSLPGKTLPMDYSILPGVRLGYPFLAAVPSASLLLSGLSLRFAVILPSVVMMALVFSGFTLLALRVCHSRRGAVLAFYLVFLNGGLGFLYAYDMMGVSLGAPGNNQLQSGIFLERLTNILQGWYQTPANHAEFTRYNLRWSNIVADMLLPQRTFLAGWAILMPCLYLLLDMVKSKRWPVRNTLLLGLMAGGLPLIHTHSFLALGLFSFGLMAVSLIKKEDLRPWLLYGALAVFLALPQLLAFTFAQSGGEGFVRFQFNWVNNALGQGLRDGYLWFYLKNLGLPFLLLVFALFEKRGGHRRLFLGAFVIFIVAEFILFQPNEYDNNKLFYVWYALCMLPAADYAFILYGRLKGLKARPLMAALALIVLFASGTLALTRESVGLYQMFSREDVALADYVREETPEGSRFITGTQHLNPVSSLAGRDIVVGPDLWLYYHGFDTRRRQDDLLAFYQDPVKNAHVPNLYGADYILLGPHERSLGGDENAFREAYPMVYNRGDYQVFRVSEEGKDD